MADSDAVEKYIYDETVETLQQKIDLIENLKIQLKERKTCKFVQLFTSFNCHELFVETIL